MTEQNAKASNILVIRHNALVREGWISMLQDPLASLGYKDFVGVNTRKEALGAVDFSDVALIVANEDFTSPCPVDFLNALKDLGGAEIPVLFFISSDPSAQKYAHIPGEFKNAHTLQEPVDRILLEEKVTHIMTGIGPVQHFPKWLENNGFTLFPEGTPASPLQRIWRLYADNKILQMYVTGPTEEELRTFKRKILEEILNGTSPAEKVKEVYRGHNGSSLTARPAEHTI